MSKFEVPIIKIDKVEHHPNADRLSLNYFREFITISAKLQDGSHRYKAGDYAVYVPEGAVVPEQLLRKGFWNDEKNRGMLAGSNGDRVKAIKLRGIVSQGIMFSVDMFDDFNDEEHFVFRHSFPDVEVIEGMDVSSILGIKKFEPVIPASMSGDVTYIGSENTLKFDIENIQKYPYVLNENEFVSITEKLHGTFCGLGYVKGLDNPDIFDNDFFCFSKGLGSQGLVFKNADVNREKNVYVKTLLKYLDKFKKLVDDHDEILRIYILGEVYGQGIQDLHYDVKTPEFRVFDIYIKTKEKSYWSTYQEIVEYSTKMNMKPIPLLYEGPWNQQVRELKNGKTTLANHIREGIVIRADRNRYDKSIGRVILKDISPDYLTRKGNVTEFN